MCSIMIMFMMSCLAVAAANMLPKEFQYTIANPNSFSKVKYSTEFTDEYFDVYSPPIRSQYAQVFWNMMEPVPLPEKIVQRFANKTMAITGYEADQVMKTPKGDSPVPINHAYNHHYVAWLNSEYAELQEVEDDANAAGHGMGHGASKYWTTVHKMNAPIVKDTKGQQVPLSSVFSEGNGGEFRGSYHGYPPGYAQLLYSPATFHINPMQIDTKNRDHVKGQFVTGPLPKAAYPGVPHDLRDHMAYSGLLECPCTDRIKKEYSISYGTQDAGRCASPVKSQASCFAAGPIQIALEDFVNKTVADKTLPQGCSIIVHDNHMAEVVWNTAGEAACDHKGPLHKVGLAKSAVSLEVTMQQQATITMIGPADVWFGIGPGASSMCLHSVADECLLRPYGIIVDGNSVTERYLDVSIDGGRGRLLQPSINVISNTVQNGLRTVVVTRPIQGLTEEYYSFNTSSPSMYFINAKGTNLNYTWPAQVPDHAGLAKVSRLNFVNVGAPTCICETGVQGTLGGNPFNKNCPSPPTSDLAFQRNPTCSIESYVGGLSCCRHMQFLLDKDQKTWDDIQEYHLKFRFYFREYNAYTEREIKPLVRLYWQTEAFAGEYDIVQCDEGTPPEQCVQTITSRWKVMDMMNTCGVAGDSWCTGKGSNDPAQTRGIKLIYAGPHCHAPACISMELYNARTGKLLCGMQPKVGNGIETYNEQGYVALPPCVWGSPQDGAMEPPLLSLDDELLSIKKNNNTYGHYGEMASWQMRGVIVPRATSSEPFNFV